MKIGVISLQEKIENPKDIPFEDLYQRIGLNTGNLVFTNAVFRQLDGELVRIGFSFRPEQVNKEFDAVVIPAANWINSRSNWDWLSDLLEQVEVPVVTIGIGLQASNINEGCVQVNESSMRLIKILASKSPYVSTRGTFTRDWLYSQGIKNVIATGCPSLYLSFHNDRNATLDDGREEVACQSTRFYASATFNDSGDVNARLFRLAYRLKAPLIFQSEAEEIRYLVHGAFADNEELDAKKSDFAGRSVWGRYSRCLERISNQLWQCVLRHRLMVSFRWAIRLCHWDKGSWINYWPSLRYESNADHA